MRITTEEAMIRTADRIARAACMLILAGCATLAAAQAPAQPASSTPPAPSKPANFSGCVQKAPGSATDLIISTPTACARLTGDAVSADKLSGHQVDLTGIFTPRTSSTPASIQVNSVNKVGDACSDVCSLRPPGTRGLHGPSNQAVPGSEGGTPGAAVEPK
jgi:hypothetical protein